MKFKKGQKEELRNHIIFSAKELFDEYGYDGTSTAMISKQASIAEGTIYNYFPSKAELFLESFILENFDETLEVSKDTISSVSDYLFDFMELHTKKIMLLPKKLVKELFYASLQIAKKRPKLLKKLAQKDFDILDKLTEEVSSLKEKKILNIDQPKLFAELVYGVYIFEISLYLYDDQIDIESAKERIKTKINELVKIGG